MLFPRSCLIYDNVERPARIVLQVEVRRFRCNQDV
jgi:hypothetical protein